MVLWVWYIARMAAISAKMKYVDRSVVVVRAGESAAEKIGKRFGAYVRTTAQRSIKRPNKSGDPSPPGQPPRAQTKTLKSSIIFAYDPAERAVFIGARLLPGRVGKDAPEALEHGGYSTAESKGRRRRQRVEKRAFMQPALEKRLPELPLLWQNAIHQ